MQDKIYQICSQGGDYFINLQNRNNATLTTSKVALSRDKPLFSGEIYRVKNLDEISCCPQMLLFCSLDVFDQNYLYTRATTLEKMFNLAVHESPRYSAPLKDLDFEIVSVSYFGDNILSTVKNNHPFIEIIVKHRTGAIALYRIYTEVPDAIIAISDLQDRNYLSGDFLPGYSYNLSSCYLKLNYGDALEINSEITTTNSVFNRTVFQFKKPFVHDETQVNFLVLEWRPVLFVHQYYYEIYNQIEFTDDPTSVDIFKIFNQINDFSKSLVEKPNLNQIYRINIGTGATSSKTVYDDILRVENARPYTEITSLSKLKNTSPRPRQNLTPILPSHLPQQTENIDQRSETPIETSEINTTSNLAVDKARSPITTKRILRTTYTNNKLPDYRFVAPKVNTGIHHRVTLKRKPLNITSTQVQTHEKRVPGVPIKTPLSLQIKKK